MKINNISLDIQKGKKKPISFDASDAKYETCAARVYLTFVFTPQRLEDVSGSLESSVGANLLLT